MDWKHDGGVGGRGGVGGANLYWFVVLQYSIAVLVLEDGGCRGNLATFGSGADGGVTQVTPVAQVTQVAQVTPVEQVAQVTPVIQGAQVAQVAQVAGRGGDLTQVVLGELF